MRIHPKDSRIAELDSLSEFPSLSPQFCGASYYSETLRQLGRDFDRDRAGLKHLKPREKAGKEVSADVSALVIGGEVQVPEFRLRRQPHFHLRFNLYHRAYLKTVFQTFADEVTPAFGDNYKVRLEDRSFMWSFHVDRGRVIGSLGLDENMTATMWQKEGENNYEVLHPRDGSLMIVLPELYHSSPNVARRPIISAAKLLPV